MTIPNQRIVANELLILLDQTRLGRMHCNDVYPLLADKFPALTKQEMELPYRNAKSKWANTVQYARWFCVKEGYIYPPKDRRSGGSGYWTITEAGKEYVRSNYLGCARAANKP